MLNKINPQDETILGVGAAKDEKEALRIVKDLMSKNKRDFDDTKERLAFLNSKLRIIKRKFISKEITGEIDNLINEINKP